MSNVVQTLRSTVAGNRPAPGSRQPGELYTNWPDQQIGVIDINQNPMDLIGCRYFSPNAQYVQGDIVAYQGSLYSAFPATILPGAWNPANWLVLGASAAILSTPPANPTAGDLWYDSVSTQLYIYYTDATSSQWVIANNAGGGANVNVSGTPPTNPNEGDLWWNSSDTNLYVFNSSQWVVAMGGSMPMSGGVFSGLISGVAPTMNDNSNAIPTTAWVNAEIPLYVSGGANGFVNKFDNAAFDVWQRGSVNVASGGAAITADRWWVSNTGAITTASWIQIGAGSKGRSRGAMSLAGAAGATMVQLYQRIESLVAAELYTGTDTFAVTFQALIYNNTAAAFAPTLSLNYPASGAQDNWGSGGTTFASATLQSCPPNQWTRVSYTFGALAVNIQQGMSVAINFGGALNNGTLYFTQADIRITPGWPVGLCPNPPPPELRPYALEILACQRMYETSWPPNGAYNSDAGRLIYNTGFGAAVLSHSGWTDYKTTKRITPTLTIVSPNNGAAGFIYDAQSAANLTAVIFNQNVNGFSVYASQGSAQTAVNFRFHFTASAEI